MPDPLLGVLEQNYSDPNERRVPSLQGVLQSIGGGGTTAPTDIGQGYNTFEFDVDTAAQALMEPLGVSPEAPAPLPPYETQIPTPQVQGQKSITPAGPPPTPFVAGQKPTTPGATGWLQRPRNAYLQSTLPGSGVGPQFNDNPIGYIAKTAGDVIDFTVYGLAKMAYEGTKAVAGMLDSITIPIPGGRGEKTLSIFSGENNLDKVGKNLEEALSGINPEVNPLFGGKNTELARAVIKVGDAIPMASAYIGEKVTDAATEMGFSPDVAAGIGTVVNVVGLIAAGWAGKKLTPRAKAGVRSAYKNLSKSLAENNRAGVLQAIEEFETRASSPAHRAFMEEANQRATAMADRMQQMREQFPEAFHQVDPDLGNFFESHSILTTPEQRAMARFRQRQVNQRARFNNPVLDELDARRAGISVEEYQNIKAGGTIEPHIIADQQRARTPSQVMTEVLQENEVAQAQAQAQGAPPPAPEPTGVELPDEAVTASGEPVRQGTAHVEGVTPDQAPPFIPREYGKGGKLLSEGGEGYRTEKSAKQGATRKGWQESHEAVPIDPDNPEGGWKLVEKPPPPPLEQEFRTTQEPVPETVQDIPLETAPEETAVNPQVVAKVEEAASAPEKVPVDPASLDEAPTDVLQQQYEVLRAELLNEGMNPRDVEAFTFDDFLENRRKLGEQVQREVAQEVAKPDTTPANILEVAKNEGTKTPRLKGQGARKAVIFDPQQVRPTRSLDEIVVQGQQLYQELSRELTRAEIQAHPDIVALEKEAAQLTRNKEIFGTEHPTVDDVRAHRMRTALNEDRRFAEVLRDSDGNMKLREYSKKQMEAKLELNKGDKLRPTNLTTEQKLQEIRLKETTPLGVSGEEFWDAIYKNDPSILERIHPDKVQEATAFFKEQTNGITSAGPRDGRAIVNDIYNFISSILGEERGALGGRFNQEQRAMLSRLQADAKKTGQDIVNLMRRTKQFSEAQLALFRQHIDANDVPIKKYDGPKNIPKDTEAAALGDYVFDQGVEQQVIPRASGGDLYKQPRYWSDISLFHNSKDLFKAKIPFFQKFVTNPRQLEAAGLQNLQYAYRAVEENLGNSLVESNRAINQAFKGLSRKELRNITANGLARTKEGRAINAYNAVVPQALNPREAAALNFIDQTFSNLLQNINEVRRSVGVEEIVPIDNYFTHARTLNWLERIGEGSNLGQDPALSLNNQYLSHRSAAFIHERKRVGGAYNVEYNAKRVLQTYNRRALTHIHRTPFNSRIHELITRTMPDPKTGEYTWLLKNERPNLYNVLKDWNNYLSGKSDTTAMFGPAVSHLMNRMNQNLVYSLLSYNYRSAAIQWTAGLKTAMEINPRWAAQGVSSLLSDYLGPVARKLRIDPNLSNYEFALQHSNILRFRNADVMLEQMGSSLKNFVEEFRGNIENLGDTFFQFSDPQIRNVGGNIRSAVRGEGALGLSRTGGAAVDVALAGQKIVGDAGLAALKYLDHQTAVSGWLGAFKRYMHNIEGATIRDAARYADDVITRTQGSALMGDIAPIQRTAGGRFLTLFQTYAINDFNFLTREVLGIKGTIDPRSIPAGSWKKIAGYVAGTIIANQVLESGVFFPPVNSPMSRPLKDFSEGFKSGGIPGALGRSVTGQLDIIPGIGQITKFGKVPGPPAMQAVIEIFNALQDRPFNQGVARTLGTTFGAPGTSQYSRYHRARKRGDSWYRALGGFYIHNPESSGSYTRGGSRTRGSRSYR